jgi:hypothetical protein
VVWLANRYLMTPAIYGALHAKGLSSTLPEDFRAYTAELYELNRRRNQRLKEQTLEAVVALNGCGIEPLLLKGAAHLFSDTFSDTGARVMTDLDLLVPRAAFDRARTLLEGLGYRAHGARYQHYGEYHHAPPLFRPGDYATLELHRQPLPTELTALMPEQAVWSGVEVLDKDGARLLVLKPTSQLLLNIIHSQIIDQHHACRVIELRQLYDLVFTCHAHPEQVDWSAISAQLTHYHKDEVLRPYLYLAHRLLAMPLPRGLEPNDAALRHYHRALRQLKWFWFASDGITRLQRFWHGLSTATIRGRYGDDDRPGAILRGRLQFLTYMLKKHAQD